MQVVEGDRRMNFINLGPVVKKGTEVQYIFFLFLTHCYHPEITHPEKKGPWNFSGINAQTKASNDS